MADQFTGRTVAEKFRIDSPVGETADLFRATHLLMEKNVWIRVLPPASAAAHFFREAKAAADLAHTNLLSVIDFGTDAAGISYIVYEPAEGETLRDSIERNAPMSVADVTEISRQAASALAAMSSAEMLHGDLSPERIILTDDGDVVPKSVKVVEFGSANVITADRDVVAARAADFHYISPEQCSGSDSIDQRSDIYSLGVIMFEMLTGKVPFAGEKPTDVMLRHIEEPPPPLSAFRKDLPSELEAVVMKALAKNPELRYQTAAEIVADLEPVEAAKSAKAKAGGNFWTTAALTVIGIAMLASALIYATYSRTADPVTRLEPDLNGIPVQPINPATGVEEQNLIGMPGSIGGVYDSNTMSQPEGTLPGGDGYNAWATGQPPPGAPPQNYVPPGGQVYTIDPNNPSQFMPLDGGVVLVPVPANTIAEKKPSPTPTPQTPPANTAAGSGAETKPAVPKPSPAKPPAVKPAPKPADATPEPEER